MADDMPPTPLGPTPATVRVASGGPAPAVPWADLGRFVAALAAHGEAPALLDLSTGAERRVSYRDLADRALRLAAGLQGRGVGPGTRVLLFGPNSLEWVTARLALAALGALTVALDDLSTDAELAVLVPDSRARLGFVAGHHIGRPGLAADGGLDLIALDAAGEAAGLPGLDGLLGATPLDPPPLDREAPHMQVYTSGTTGQPKSFLLAHRHNLHNVAALVAQAVVGADDRLLLPLPLHHVYPLTVGLLAPLASGSMVILPEAVDGPRLARAMQAGRATAIIGVPRLYGALAEGIAAKAKAAGGLSALLFPRLLALSRFARQRFGLRLGRRLFGKVHRSLSPDLWLLGSGGARFEAELIWTLEALGWDVRSGWGLAETASILTNNGGGADKHVGAEGRPLAGVEVRVADPDGDGIGELQARGPSVFAGYLDNDEANAAAFTGDGWFRSGDLGWIDDRGFVHIAGRLKEMIVLGGGKNVFPDELEKVYGASPLIGEVAVVERKGALVALAVPDQAAIRAAGYAQPEDAVRVALTTAAQDLPPFQRIVDFAVTAEELPKNRLGKYQRFLILERFETAKAGATKRAAPAWRDADRALVADPAAAPVWTLLQARFPDRDLHPDQSLTMDLGIDSLDWVNLSLALSQDLGLTFTVAEAEALFTLGDLLRAAAAKRRAGETADTDTHTGSAAAPGRLPPVPADLGRWLAPLSPAQRLLRPPLFALTALLIRGYFGRRIAGLEHVPVGGPLIIACNHVSDVDPFIMVDALGRARLEHTWWSGDVNRLFAGPVSRLFSRLSQIFPVDERDAGATLAAAVEVLRRDRCLVWFPESWRSPDGELQRFLPGIGVLVAEIGCPVVPARIFGAFEAWPRTRSWPLAKRVAIRFAPAIDGQRLVSETGGDPAAIAARIREAVAAVGPNPNAAPR